MQVQPISELLAGLRSPTLPVDLRNLSKVILPVSGTLLGLVYAGLIYWFQGALDRLTYTSKLLEDIVSINGKVLLDLLVGVSLVSLFGIFELEQFAAVAFWFFAFFVTIDVIRATAEHGYLITISTSKYIPKGYGQIRAFLRKLRNAGPLHWFRDAVVLLLTIGYPIWIGSEGGLSWNLSSNSLAVFLLVSLAIGLIRIRSLLLEALEVRKQLKDRLTNANQNQANRLEEPEEKWDEKKRTIEREIVNERLERLDVKEAFEADELDGAMEWSSRDIEDTPVLKAPPWIKENGSCHLNLYVPYYSSARRTRVFIIRWSRKIITELVQSKSEVHYYSLSWFRKEDDSDSHFAMIRTTKADALSAVESAEEDREFLRELSGIFVDNAIVE